MPVALDLGTGARSVFLATFVDAATVLAYVPRTFSTAVQVRDFVRATPAAWGYVDLAFTASLHVVPLRGRRLHARDRRRRHVPGAAGARVRHARAPARAGARFVRWVRTSRTARRVIDSRYVPVG